MKATSSIRPRSGPRVVHLVPFLFSREDGILGGAERYVLELARHMASRVPTSLVSFGSQPGEFMSGDLRVRVIAPYWKVRGQRQNPISPRVIRELYRSDVIHCHQQHILGSSLAALVGRAGGKRVFVTDLGGGAWDISAYISTDRWYHGHLHISEYSRAIHEHVGRPTAHVILGGVDTRKFFPDPRIPRTGRILFVGRLLPHKGLLDLVDALPPGVSLDLIGAAYDGDFFRQLSARAAGKDVTFRHDCDDDAIVAAYRACACIVLPSVYKADGYPYSPVPELLGQTLLEGMACGAPGLCTRVASLPEVVVDGVTGFVVPPNDPEALRARMLWLLDHPSQARAMGLEGEKRVRERFTWDAVVDRCLAIYSGAGGTAVPTSDEDVPDARLDGGVLPGAVLERRVTCDS